VKIEIYLDKEEQINLDHLDRYIRAAMRKAKREGFGDFVWADKVKVLYYENSKPKKLG
jgi:hypothetical protein